MIYFVLRICYFILNNYILVRNYNLREKNESKDGFINMSKKEEKRKINFIKNYWHEILKIDIYTYEESKLNNMNTYINELIGIISLLEKQKEVTKEKNGLLYFLKEFEAYINKNYFFNKTYYNHVNAIKSKISSIIKLPREHDVKHKLIVLKETLIYFNEQQDQTVDRMLRDLSFLVYSNQNLEGAINNLKSLVNDLIVQLLLENYDLGFLRKDVYEETTFDIETKNIMGNSLREQFQQMLEKLKSKTRVRDTIVIFRINNLKLQMPFEINGVVFYNPLRADLLEWKYSSKLLRGERGLLTLDESRLIDKKEKSYSNLSEADWDEIKYTDAHCRIKLNNVNPNLAVQIGKKRIEEIITTVRYIYKVENISISENYVIQCGLRSRSPLCRFERNSKFSKGAYRSLQLYKELDEDLLNKDSIINSVLMSTDNMFKDSLMKGLRSLHLGEDEKLKLNKFIHFWISLEYLCGLSAKSTIKTNLLNKGSKALVRYYYYHELHSIYKGLRDEFYKLSMETSVTNTKVPKEITVIQGLDDFMFKYDSKALADNLSKFVKYCKDEYLKYRIKSFIDIYENINKRRWFISRLELNYKNLLSRLYRIRNRIVHSALVDEIELELYCEWLHSILIAFCNDLIYKIYDSNGNYILATLDESSYRDWKLKSEKEKHIILF
ncbi:hypothetical protein BUM91_14990 [Bacillus thuringiensis]|nr:hypothetical protein BUM91_14990 [Bacillus thuringiensis]